MEDTGKKGLLYTAIGKLFKIFGVRERNQHIWASIWRPIAIWKHNFENISSSPFWDPGPKYPKRVPWALNDSCPFKVIKVLVVYFMVSTKSFITLKGQEIESWDFVCPNILKRCAWRPNFGHISWEMTKISTVPVQHRCPTFSIGHSIWLSKFDNRNSVCYCTFLIEMSSSSFHNWSWQQSL